ncbi:uncharacterized protein TM35_000921040 [Trypanosoma theileri]|uniref:Uncharacterized protein n=1 Tax=Trypanosoma theileri TaxID=67003 RepID=A0A1X0NF40_9TRYP|nr:uncharacterized protein TM35_000921040 [Trypanosoma theileri]ORC82360.1 hypothetical protein TM35_000921040 [Trypanosoma theileri]
MVLRRVFYFLVFLLNIICVCGATGVYGSSHPEPPEEAEALSPSQSDDSLDQRLTTDLSSNRDHSIGDLKTCTSNTKDCQPDPESPLEVATSECSSEPPGTCKQLAEVPPHHSPAEQRQESSVGAGEACSSGTTGTRCSSSGVDTEGSHGECDKLPKKEDCATTERTTKGNCGDDSGKTCPANQSDLTQKGKDHRGGQGVSAERGSVIADSSGKTSESGPGHSPTDTDPSTLTLTVVKPAAGESVGASTTAAQPESSGNSERGERSTKSESEATQSSSNTSDKESTNGSETNTAGSGTTSEGVEGGSDATTNEKERTPAESERTNNQETSSAESESNTTTITTTTLPPELTNNKKGDADSSSSISSSVWVRVPLLIVVTLACILVC